MSKYVWITAFAGMTESREIHMFLFEFLSAFAMSLYSFTVSSIQYPVSTLLNQSAKYSLEVLENYFEVMF
jgi:hypothetical protein